MQNIRVPDGAIFLIWLPVQCEVFADGPYQANGRAILQNESAI
jgi:hypothetical protein